MRKILPVMLAAALGLSVLSGCSSSTTETAAETTGAAASESQTEAASEGSAAAETDTEGSSAEEAEGS